MKGTTVLTTGEIARMLATSPRTVSKWIDSGELPGYRLPLTPDRRVARSALLAFLQKHNVPIPPELGLPLAIVAGDTEVAEQLRTRLYGWRVEPTENVWATAVTATKSGGRLGAVVVSGLLGRADAKAITQALANQQVRRIVLLVEDDDGSAWQDDPSVVLLRYPVSIDDCIRAIRSIEEPA